MTIFDANRNNTANNNYQSQTRYSYDAGLRQYLISVFNYIAFALGITGISAYFFSTSGIYDAIAGTPLIYLIMFAPLGFVIFLNAKISTLSLQATQICLGIFSIIMGLSLSWIFLVYTNTSIVKVFMMTSSIFGLMSVYGYTTKKDLSSMGSFLIMGLLGIIVISIINLFLKSPAIHFAISFIVLFIFIGLTAYDMQRIKKLYYDIAGSTNDSQQISKIAAHSSLSLYFNFINIFLSLLQFFGDRRD